MSNSNEADRDALLERPREMSKLDFESLSTPELVELETTLARLNAWIKYTKTEAFQLWMQH